MQKASDDSRGIVAIFFLLTHNFGDANVYTRYPENMPWLETFHCLNFGCNIKVLLAKSIAEAI